MITGAPLVSRVVHQHIDLVFGEGIHLRRQDQPGDRQLGSLGLGLEPAGVFQDAVFYFIQIGLNLGLIVFFPDVLDRALPPDGKSRTCPGLPVPPG